MSEIRSKEWNWKIVSEKYKEVWKNPSIESYYLVNRWKNLQIKDILDLGCGLGRHTILFAVNGFDVHAFDLSREAVEKTKEWAEELNLKVNYKVGDMLELPYDDNSMDGMLCFNVISHTDTQGIKKVISEINRVLRPGGECYLTLGSKDSWGFKQEDWPMADKNTRIRMEEGPEKGIPHFFADYELIVELFKDNNIELIKHVEDFIIGDTSVTSSFHYHLLISKK